MKQLLFILLIGVFFSCSAYAVDLDAPITKKPTIRSEIQRGGAVTSDCLSGILTYSETSECISDILEAEEKNNAGTDAFKLGVFFEGYTHYAILESMNIPMSDEDSSVKKLCHNAAQKLMENFKLQRKDIYVILKINGAVMDPLLKAADSTL